jgi:Cu-processing system ATP-binding protein
MTPTIAVKNLTKRYGAIEAVRDVSFDLRPAEIIALVGHNGAGKTTLLKLMLGLAHPSAGTIRVLGEDPAAGEFAARRRLGYLPENVSFNPALTAREVLTFYARLKDRPVEQALGLLDRVGLGSASRRRIGTYSKGMRQRLGLAQALIGDPQVLLLDEPTSGLDPALRLEFYDIVEARRAAGATVVLSSHALAELGDRAGRIIIMNQGMMVANGSIDQLRHLAHLPAKIRCRVADGNADAISNELPSTAGWRRVNGHTIEIDAAPEDKIALLHLVTTAGAPVVDVDVVPPSLDELYAHFLRAEAAR